MNEELTNEQKIAGLADEVNRLSHIVEQELPLKVREAIAIAARDLDARWQELDDDRVVAAVSRNRSRILSALFLDPFKDLARKVGDAFTPHQEPVAAQEPAVDAAPATA